MTSFEESESAPSALLEQTRTQLVRSLLRWFAWALVPVMALSAYQAAGLERLTPSLLALCAVVCSIVPLHLLQGRLGAVGTRRALMLYLARATLVALPFTRPRCTSPSCVSAASARCASRRCERWKRRAAPRPSRSSRTG